jgi:hypothetical protein
VTYGDHLLYVAVRRNVDCQEIVVVDVLKVDGDRSMDHITWVWVKEDEKPLGDKLGPERQIIEDAITLGKAYWTALNEVKAPRQ